MTPRTLLTITTAAVLTALIGNLPTDTVVAQEKFFIYHDPETTVAWAKRDQLLIHPEERQYTRYITLYNTPPEERELMIRVLNFCLNLLSTERHIKLSPIVANTDNTLIRVNLAYYGISPKAWDNLGTKGSGPDRVNTKQDFPEPYFHVILKTGTKKTVRKAGKPYQEKGRWIYPKDTYETIPAFELQHGGWVNPQEIVDLAVEAYSDFPIFRADWFIFNAMLAPAYYELQGIKTFADFQRITRYRKDDIDLAIRGVVTDSKEVALHNRAAQRIQTALGYWWETLDYLSSLDDKDLLENLLLHVRDAGEIIASGLNRLHKFALVDDKDTLLDKGNTDIVVDATSPWRNKTIYAGGHCLFCHMDGIKEVTDEVRLLARPRVALLVRKKKEYKQVVDLFSTPIDQQVRADQHYYNEAVKQATGGLSAREAATAYQKFFIRYIQENLTLRDGAVEVGFPTNHVKNVIGRLKNPHHTLTQLYQGRPVRRDQWEAKGFSQLITVMRKVFPRN